MRLMVRRTATVVAAVSLTLAGVAGATATHQPTTDAQAPHAASADWPMFGNSTDNVRFSTLTQINAGNVSKLGVAWTMQEGKNLAAWETVPVVVNGVMYLTTNTDQVRAVNAATGELIWQYTPQVDFYHSVAGGGGGVPTNRGVAVVNGKVYLLTFDARMIALQASTGEVIWDVSVANKIQGYGESSPPTYWNGMLFVGAQEGDAGMRGFEAAYDANTGKQIWRFYTVPAPGHGWNSAQGNHGGGDVWMPSVIDSTTGILYLGTGNPSPDFTNAVRSGCNPWVDAVVALNARTGKFIWGHTEICNDVWDYDALQSPILFNLTQNGKTTRVVGNGNKGGQYFFFDAASGKVLAISPYLSEWSVPHLKPNAAGVRVCPGTAGGIEFSPPAYSPATHAVYQPVTNACQIFSTIPLANTQAHRLGTVDTGGAVAPSGPMTGAMAAVDARTGKVLWKDAMSKPMFGGSLATAGNLAFAGGDDGHFYAFDARTGKILYSPNFGLAFGAPPIAYAVNGTEYIAIAAGGASVSAADGSPLGGTLAVLKLGGTPITKPFPAAAAGSGLVSVKLPSLKGYTRLNPWMYVDTTHQHVVIVLVAGETGADSGFNFDGYYDGKANFIVPANWTVDLEFSNKAALPHSAGIVKSTKTPPQLQPFGFGVAVTPNALGGTGHGVTQLVSFVADHAGSYFVACLVPGHIQSGMWDHFTISNTAKLPSIQTTK
ncbi:MAG TPA: PQQ-binding-like beta-propeller repeat protein [Chloroflexota bacterium]